MDRGLFIGRFQPFHSGHLRDIKNALEEVGEIIIGIGSSNEENTKENPFTVRERVEMINIALAANNIKKYVVFTIPDFNDDIKWVNHIEATIPKFEVVYTGNEWTEKCFEGKYEVRKVKMLKGVSSTTIRSRIIKNQNWQRLVPEEIVNYISKIKGVQRVKEICTPDL
jgi:nicotinamide-nucleotide adenylyltransferase|tara:strand:- start:890 stop:1393 length:504 start_codon:yes stop_codon:yes gene_type:complete